MPGGQPSTTTPSAGPWLSPQVVKRNNWPKVLNDMEEFAGFLGQRSIEEALAEATTAKEEAATATENEEEPDVTAAAGAAHAAQAAIAKARDAMTAAETALREAADSAADPTIQAMRDWVDSKLAGKI